LRAINRRERTSQKEKTIKLRRRKRVLKIKKPVLNGVERIKNYKSVRLIDQIFLYRPKVWGYLLYEFSINRFYILRRPNFYEGGEKRTTVNKESQKFLSQNYLITFTGV